MIEESPTVQSGVTICPGQIVENSYAFSAISICLGNFLNQLSNDQGLTISNGQLNILPLPIFYPNIFNFFFGQNAYQDINILRINKSDLVGLTPSANNTAESLFAAILMKIMSGQRIVFTRIIDFEYWGYGTNKGKRIDTVLIKFYNQLAVVDTYEISQYNNTVNPNDY